MSAETKQYQIITSQDGTFKVNADGKTVSTGSYINRDGCGMVQFGGEPTPAQVLNVPKPSEELNAAGGGLELTFDGRVKSMAPETYNPVDTTRPVDVLSQVTDLAGRVERDMSKVRANPAAYKAKVGATEATIESLMRAGVLSIGGDGNFVQDKMQTMSLINPKDPSNPLHREQFMPKESPVIEFGDAGYKTLESITKAVGLDTGTVLAKTLEGKTVGKELAQLVGQGTDPDKLQASIENVVANRVLGCVSILDELTGSDKGADILDWAMNKLSRPQARQLVHGMLTGSKEAFKQAIRRYGKDRN